MFIAGNSYSGQSATRFSVVRYGNVMGSRGSVIPFFVEHIKKGYLPITDPRMTRFMMPLEDGVRLVWHALTDMVGGEIYVKKIPSINITDIAEAIAPNLQHKIIGIRPGEKLHEQMIGSEDAPYTIEYPQFYKILPAIYAWNLDPLRIKNGVRVSHDFIYNSDSNSKWMSVQYLRDWVKENYSLIGKS